MEEPVKRFLSALHIHVKEKWLHAAISFSKLHGKGNKEGELCSAVFEQFIHSNLCDAYEPLAKVPTVALRAVIVKPMIFQYRECTESVDDLSWFNGDDGDGLDSQALRSSRPIGSSGGRRLLKVKLCDGQNVAHAIEYGGELALDENTLPGTKILLTARVLLRRGILLLNNSNCQVLGGGTDEKPHGLALMFAERLGIKHDVKSNRRVLPVVPCALPPLMKSKKEVGQDRSQNNTSNVSTISPFLVRAPRIPKQLLQNPETDAQEMKETVKKETYDFERTAVVPPLQSVCSVIPYRNIEESKPLDNIRKLNVASNVSNRLLLPLQNYGGNNQDTPSLTSMEDLPIHLNEVKLVPHQLPPPAKQRKISSFGKNNDSVMNRSIADYFPVSRVKSNDDMFVSKVTGGDIAKPTHPAPLVPLSKQQLVVVPRKNDELVNAGPLQQSVTPVQENRMTPVGELRNNDNTPPVESFRHQSIQEMRSCNSTNGQFTVHPCQQSSSAGHLEDSYYTNHQFEANSVDRDFAIIDDSTVITTQQLLNPSDTDGIHSQNQDLISFMERSVSSETNTKEFSPPPRSQSMKEHPLTAIVPYKQGRGHSPPLNTVPEALWPVSKTSSSRVKSTIMDRFFKLGVVLLGDALAQRKFWMLPKRMNVMGVCHVKGELSAKHGSWLLDIYVTDESVNSQLCVVDSQLLERLLGFSVKHCEKMNLMKNMYELSRCKERALEVMKSFQRLDLVLTLEIYPHRNKSPLVTDVRTLAEAVDSC